MLLETGTTGLVVRGEANRAGGGGRMVPSPPLCQGHFCNFSKLKLGRNYRGGEGKMIISHTLIFLQSLDPPPPLPLVRDWLKIGQNMGNVFIRGC